MNKKTTHTNQELKTDSSSFFNKVEIPYEKSKEEVWQQLEQQLTEEPVVSKTVWIPPKLISSIAAGLLILFSVLSVMRYYTKTIQTPLGQHLAITLPDGSTVNLNAQSKLTYHPYWWAFSRTVGFEGEGFFNVEKGRKFEVISNFGRTEVIGTSFNIYNRDKDYRVSCLSGSVKVTSNTKKEVILSPDYHAEVDTKGDILVLKEADTDQTIFWVNNMFTFTAVPLSKVIEEIERQYNVSIQLNTTRDYFYTGFFSRDKSVEEVLNLLSKTFNFTFVKRSDSKYEIIQIVTE